MPLGYFTTDNINYNDVWKKYILPGVDRYNRIDKVDLKAMLCSDNDETIKSVYVGNSGAMQELGETEKPDVRKMATGKFQGLTKYFGSGYGYTYLWLKDKSLQLITDLQANIMEQSRKNHRKQILSAMFTDSTNGFWNGSFGSLEGLTTPPTYEQNTFGAGHTHYYGSNTTTITQAVISAARKHIVEHGNGGRLVGFINSDDEEDLVNLMSPTSSTVKVSNPITDKFAIDGYIDRMFGVDWIRTEIIPAGYMLIVEVATTSANKVCKFNVPTNPSFRGLKIHPGSNPSWPILESFYTELCGAKVWDRGAGVSIQIHASTAYTDPTII